MVEDNKFFNDTLIIFQHIFNDVEIEVIKYF